jgi:hypothetical protein
MPRHRFMRALYTVLPVLGAAGCSDLASPAATAVPAPSISASYLDVEEPQALGSPHDIAANEGLGVPGWVQATNIGTLPDSAWILIEVRGTVLHTKHPWCDQLYSATGGCNYTLDGVRLGPLERHGGSGAIVSLLSPGVVPNPYFSIGEYQYAPDGNVHGDVARTVVRNTSGPKAVWFRRLDATPKPGSATMGVYGPMYYMSSDQKVTARVIPSPLRVNAPADVGKGEVVTFSVSPTGDFKFRMPDWRPHFVYWRYFPGDTAARPNPFGPRQDVPCDSIVCRWEPPTSGRMWAFTYVDGFGVEAKSQVVRLDSAELELICPDSIMRGQRIDCAVRAKPRGELTDMRWRFADDAGHQIPGPNEYVWGGPMVISGTISVSANLNGLPVAESRRISVTARNWRDELPPGSVDYKSCPRRTRTCPQSPLTRERDTGITFLAGPLIKINFRAEPVAEGPNTGWWYVAGTEPPVELPGPVTRLNPDLFNPRSAFYTARRRCRPEDVQYWIRTHEAVHVAIGLERAAEGWINRALESRMAFRPATDPEFIDETFGFIEDRIAGMLDNDHDLHSRYPAKPCDLNLAA